MHYRKKYKTIARNTETLFRSNKLLERIYTDLMRIFLKQLLGKKYTLTMMDK